MNGSAAATPSFPRPLPRLRVHGRRAEVASVAAGTVLVGLQALRLGPLLSDDAAVSFAALDDPGGAAVDPSAGPAWLMLLELGRRAGLFQPGGDTGLFPLALALLCTAGLLAAAGSTARVLLGRSAWPVPLLAGAALAASPDLVGRLFSGLGTPLYVCAVALLARALAGGAARAWRDCTAPAVGAGLAAALAVAATDDALALAAAWPLALLCAPGLPFTRERLTRAVRPAGAYLLAFGLPYAALPPARHALLGHRLPATEAASAAGGAAPMAVALIAAGVAGAALARRGRPRGVLAAVCVPPALTAAAGGPEWALGAVVTALAAAVVWRAERTGGRLALAAALACGMALSLTAQPGAQPARAAETSLCYTGARYGDMFGEYARRLGLAHSTVALPAPGGALLAGDQRVLDLSGRTDHKVAVAREDGRAALRRYVLRRARPEFIHIEQPFIDRTGLTARVLTAHGYRPLLREGDGGDFVARSAVTAPQRLPELRRWAEQAARQAHTHAAHAGPACA